MPVFNCETHTLLLYMSGHPPVNPDHHDMMTLDIESHVKHQSI